MEEGLTADLALVHAWKGDTEGNLVYRKTARNFNPMMATAAKLTVAEVEHLVEPGADRPRHHRHAGHLRPAHRPCPRRREAHRATHHAQARRRLSQEKPHGLDPRSDGGARREGIARRLLRQSRHRHPDAGVELHPRGHARSVAERERHARHGAVPVRGRGGRRPHQRRQADRHANCRPPAISPAPSRSP